MNNLFLIVLFFVLIQLPGCSRLSPTDATQQSDTTNVSIIMVDDLSTAGPAIDNAQIKSAFTSSDVLTIVEQHGGGCAPHEFKLFGSKLFLESFPPQADIVLSHNAHEDLCKALITDTLRFSLIRLREVYQSSYGNKGTLLLRLHEPGKQEPISSLVRYEF
jgi:hypothetical protein